MVKKTTGEITALLDNFCKLPDTKRSDCVSKIMAIVDANFDWEVMARRTLARHWKKRTAPEKEKFVSLFRDLLKDAYIGKIESYAGEKVVYKGETIHDKYSVVKTKVISPTRKS